MNLLLILEDFNIGGAQIFAVRLANALSKHHIVFLYNCRPTVFDGRLKKQVSPSVRMAFIHYRWFWAMFWVIEKFFRPFPSLRKNVSKSYQSYNLKRLERLIRRAGITVLNSHMYYADLFASQLKTRMPHLHHVISMHGCYENKFELPVHAVSTRGRQALLNCDAVVIAAEKNRYVLQQLQIEPRVNVVKIYYGFEPSPSGFKPAGSTSFTFGIASRAIPEKGWEDLIQAFQLLQKKYSSIRLLLVGGGAYQAQLVRRYGHERGIFFCGHADNPIKFVRQMNVGMLPTRFKGESLPNSVIEYLSEGKPVIATHVGEIKNMITAGNALAGQLLEADAIQTDKLAAAMERYLLDAGLFEEHSRLAHVAFKKFDMATCVAAYFSLYQSLNKND